MRNMMLGKNTSNNEFKVAVGTAVAAVVLTGGILYGLWPATSDATQLQTAPLADTTFPPPISSTLSSQPSYAVRISDPDGQSIDRATFTPNVVSIPAGMTVIWTNDGAGQHTVTTAAGNNNSPPEAIDSKMIAADGGSFEYTFTKPGLYRYADLMNQEASGIIDVGGAFQKRNNFAMLVGGVDPLPATTQGSVHGLTLRFIPTTISIPPTTAITYQVTIANSAGNLLFSKTFDDTDGILDLELVPQTTTATNTGAASQFVTWGPDFAGQEGYGSTGTFHVQGPFSTPSQYTVTVKAVSKDNSSPSDIKDRFSISLPGK